jgi:hypothetical protein
MILSDEVLMAYADDELDGEARAAVEAAMASDPAIANRIAQHQALRNRIHSAFNKVLDEPLPAPLATLARRRPAGRDNDNIVPLRRQPAPRWRWPHWTAIAASLLVGVIAGRLALLRARNPGPVVMTGGRLLAAGALADALSNQLAWNQKSAGSVRIGVSFRSKSGEYCRTFTLSSPAPLAGLACRAPDAWQVGVLARTESSGAGSVDYRQAASVMPPAVASAVENQIAGAPLDARGEATARSQHWSKTGT